MHEKSVFKPYMHKCKAALFSNKVKNAISSRFYIKLMILLCFDLSNVHINATIIEIFIENIPLVAAEAFFEDMLI